jgi:hypothetical protein
MELLLKFPRQIFEGSSVHQLPLDLRPHWFVSVTRDYDARRERSGKGLSQYLGLLVEKNGTLEAVGLSRSHSDFRLPT